MSRGRKFLQETEVERKIEVNGILASTPPRYDSIAYINYHHSNVNLELKRVLLSSQFDRGITVLCAGKDEVLCTFCDSRRDRKSVV